MGRVYGSRPRPQNASGALPAAAGVPLQQAGVLAATLTLHRVVFAPAGLRTTGGAAIHHLFQGQRDGFAAQPLLGLVLDEHRDEIAHAPAVEPVQFLVDDLLDPSPIDGGEAFGQPVDRVFDGDALVAGGGSRRLFAHARSVRPRRGRRKGLPGPSASAVVGCG